MDERPYKYLFGPVASRRLGRSLGVDIVPYKTCSYDCVYCQCGKTRNLTVERKEYVKPKEVLDELRRRVNEGLEADYITFSGSGEPTLNSKIGTIISSAKKITGIPVAVLTNGSLLYEKGVRDSLMEADLVVPSLDAGSPDVFQKINRPNSEIRFDEMVGGLVRFGQEFGNKIYLEVLLVEGVNTDEAEIEKIKEIARRINPDKIQLNTVYRPTAENDVRAVSKERLEKIRSYFGANTEIISANIEKEVGDLGNVRLEDVVALLKRRPCTPEDIALGLNTNTSEVIKFLGVLKQDNLLKRFRKDGRLYYQWAG